MLQILLHSSKTMTAGPGQQSVLSKPIFSKEAQQLAAIWQNASIETIARLMKVSVAKATEVEKLYKAWALEPEYQIPAVDAFRGDIYSGLQAQTWSESNRQYAQQHLLVLSGLYGALRACDGVMPYRLEMGYKLPDERSLYQFWGDSIAQLLPDDTSHIINLSAVEYTKAILPHTNIPVVTPKFLTVSPKTGQPTFVTVHAKVARGAFARWLIVNQISDVTKLPDFTDLNYRYDPATSTSRQPVFICPEFGGLGLSVRLAR